MFAIPQPYFLTGNQRQNLAGEGDNYAAGQRQKTVGTLGGVVRLDAHAELDDALAQDNYADGLDAGDE